MFREVGLIKERDHQAPGQGRQVGIGALLTSSSAATMISLAFSSASCLMNLRGGRGGAG